MDNGWIAPGNKCREAIKMLLNIEGLCFDDAWPVIQKLMALEHKALRKRYKDLHVVEPGRPDNIESSTIVTYR